MLSLRTYRNALIGLLVCALVFAGSLASIALWQQWPLAHDNASVSVVPITMLHSTTPEHKQSYTTAAYAAQLHPFLQPLQRPIILPLVQAVQLKSAPSIHPQKHDHFTIVPGGPVSADASQGVSIEICAHTDDNSPAYGEDIYLTADPGASFLTNIVTLDASGCASAQLFSLQTGNVTFSASIYYITPLFNSASGNAALGHYALPAIGRTTLSITKASPPTPASSVFGTGHGSSPFAGKSINLALGNYVYQHTDVTLPIPGDAIVMKRTYNSLDSTDGPLGIGWTFPYNQFLKFPDDATVSVVYGDGHHEDYTLQDNVYTALTGPGTLSQLTHDGTTYVVRHKDQSQDTYDATSGKLLSMLDRNGNTIILTYDGNHLTSVYDKASGRGLSFQYDSADQITTVSNLLDNSRVATYDYDTNHHLIDVYDQLEQSTTYTYDDANHLLSVQNASGNTIVSNTYDSSNRVTLQTNAPDDTTGAVTGAITAITYKDGSTIVTDPRGKSTTYAFDFFYRQISITDPLKFVTDYTYDKNGELRTVTDADDHTVQYTYDPQGNLLNVVDAVGVQSAMPAGHTTIFSYDPKNNLVKVVDANGHTTMYSHDTNGNIMQTTDALGNVTRIKYNSFGQVLDSVSPVAGQHYQYDSYGDQTAASDSSGDTEQIAYSAANGLPNKVSDANGNSVLTSYDPANHVISVTDPLQDKVSYTYNSVGLKASATDADGNTTNYVYDANNRLTMVKNPDKTAVQYNYDANGNLLQQVDEEGHITSYAYNDNNQVLKVTDAAGHRTRYTYDGAGNVMSRTDADGHVALYAYDANNHLLEIKYTDGSFVKYAYDNVGNRLSMTDATGKSSYVYDKLNRLITFTDAAGHTLHMSYDGNGNLSRLTYPDGRIAYYSYNQNDKLAKVTDWAKRTSTYSYDKAGNLVELQLPNHVVTTYVYNLANQLTEVKNTGPNGVISDFQYALDAVGNRTGIAASGSAVERGKTFYAYDSMQHLISARYPDGSQVKYVYDKDGNRSSMTTIQAGSIPVVTTYTYDATDQLTQIQTGQTITTLTYDANGDQTGSVQNGTNRITYRYNAQGELASVSSGKTLVRYAYNGDGFRSAQTVSVGSSANTTQYVLSSSKVPQVLEEITTGQGTTDELYGLALLAATPLSASTSPSYYSYDGLGSVSNIMDSNGKVLSSKGYDAFGALRNGTGQQTEFQLNGQQVDAVDGLTYLRGRYYDSELGRFVMRDINPGVPNVAQTLNRYTYANDNPTNVVDPTGNFGIDTLVAFGIGALFGGLASIVTQYISNQSVDWASVGTAAVIGGVTAAVIETDPLLIVESAPLALTEMLPDAFTENLSEEAAATINQFGTAGAEGALRGAAVDCIKTCGTSNFSWGGLATDTFQGGVNGMVNEGIGQTSKAVNDTAQAFLKRTEGSVEGDTMASSAEAVSAESAQGVPGSASLYQETMPQQLQPLNGANA